MQEKEVHPPYRCVFCGAPSYREPSYREPSEQTPPPDYCHECHESDHGSPDDLGD